MSFLLQKFMLLVEYTGVSFLRNLIKVWATQFIILYASRASLFLSKLREFTSRLISWLLYDLKFYSEFEVKNLVGG